VTGYDDDRTRLAARWTPFYLLDVRGWRHEYHWARLHDSCNCVYTWGGMIQRTFEIWRRDETTNETGNTGHA
jgi:hypothetical protein